MLHRHGRAYARRLAVISALVVTTWSELAPASESTASSRTNPCDAGYDGRYVFALAPRARWFVSEAWAVGVGIVLSGEPYDDRGVSRFTEEIPLHLQGSGNAERRFAWASSTRGEKIERTFARAFG